MRKLYYLLIAALVVAVSCNKSTTPTDPDPTPTPTPSTEQTIEFVLPVTTEMKAFFEQQFEFDLNGTKVSFKESDMTEMTETSDLKLIPSLVVNTNKALTFMYGTDHKKTVQYYKYTLGKLKKGETVSAVSRKNIIKSDRPSVKTINFLLGYSLLIEGKENDIIKVSDHKIEVEGDKDIDDTITKLFDVANKDFRTITYTYK